MTTFDSLNQDFRTAFRKVAQKGVVRFTIEGIKDNPDDIYPIFEVSNKHVSYYSVEEQTNIVITDRPIKAVIY